MWTRNGSLILVLIDIVMSWKLLLFSRRIILVVVIFRNIFISFGRRNNLFAITRILVSRIELLDAIFATFAPESVSLENGGKAVIFSKLKQLEDFSRKCVF